MIASATKAATAPFRTRSRLGHGSQRIPNHGPQSASHHLGVTRRLRLAIIATLVLTAIASAVAVALELAAQPVAITSTAPLTIEAPIATIDAIGSGPAPATEARTARPAATCRVLPTPEPMNPPHAPVNGQPSLGVPTLPGVILIEVKQCRDIQAILLKYGLLGPATRDVDVLESDEMIANGATRWFRVGVRPGTESATVVELYQHPEDIEYVQLIPEAPARVTGP